MSKTCEAKKQSPPATQITNDTLVILGTSNVPHGSGRGRLKVVKFKKVDKLKS